MDTCTYHPLNRFSKAMSSGRVFSHCGFKANVSRQELADNTATSMKRKATGTTRTREVFSTHRTHKRTNSAPSDDHKGTDAQSTAEDPKATALSVAIAALDVAQKRFQQALYRVKRTKLDTGLETRVEAAACWQQGNNVYNGEVAELAQGLAREDEVHTTEMAALKVAQKNFTRARRRVNQIQYRQRKTNQLCTLQGNILQLQQEIETLNQRRRAVSAALPPKDNVWSASLEYFRLFRYGLQASASDWELTMGAFTPPCIQMDFVRMRFGRDTVFNGDLGVKAVMKSWLCFSLWFQDFELELEGLEKGPGGSVSAATRTSVTISERTLHKVFPHLRRRNSSEDTLESLLVDKLLHQRIVMRGSVQLGWDHGYGCFTHVVAQSDMLSPLLLLVGNLEHLSRVFDEASISPAFQWRLNPLVINIS